MKSFRDVSAFVVMCLIMKAVLSLNPKEYLWTVLSIHQDIDASIVDSTEESPSVIYCANLCSNKPDIASMYYVHATSTCHCNSNLDLKPENDNANIVQYGYRNTTHNRTDCLSLYDLGSSEDGIYSIMEWNNMYVRVQCDMTNGGWTVIQRRLGGSENFYRGWSDYSAGFGNAAGEYWIGLDILHHLTLSDSEMSVYLASFPDVTPTSVSAHYTHFSVGDNASEFLLSVSGFSGTCGDAIISECNGKKFSTFDNDNDHRGVNCAVEYKGGWWYNSCHCTNPNGRYFQQGEYVKNLYYGQGLHWCRCWSFGQSAKSILLKIRRK